MPSWREVFSYFVMLGFVNVGGPVAQITMMFNHYLLGSGRPRSESSAPGPPAR